MSKTKKILSMLLAAAMVLTMAPTSVFAVVSDTVTSSDAVSGVTVTTNGSISSEVVPTFTVTTTGTTEVLRVAAAGTGSCTYGTSIVAKATPSGMPEVASGTFKNIAYAGETPQQAVVKLNITGASITGTPSISTNLGGNIQMTANNPTTSGNTTTYSWNITGGTATVGSNVVYTITYVVNGKTYVAYAASHVENILRPTGVMMNNRRQTGSGGNKKTTRDSSLVLLQSKNMYPGWAGTGGDYRGYVNFASGNALSGGSLKGTGSENDVSTDPDGYLIKDSNNEWNTVRKFYEDADANTLYSTAYDKNRPTATIYVDSGEGDNFGSSSLDLRMTWQMCDDSDCWFNGIEGVGLYEWQSNTSVFGTTGSGCNETTHNFDGGFPTSAKSGKIAVDTTYLGTNTTNNTFVAGKYLAGSAAGLGYTDVSSGTYRLFQFSGNGQFTGDISVGVRVRGSQNVNNTSESEKYFNDQFIATTLHIVNYDSTALHSLLTAIYNNSGVDGVFKGPNPQSSYYTAGWDAYATAYKNAVSVLAAPDCCTTATDKQTEINNAVSSLKTAYNGLTGWRSSVNYTVKYLSTTGATLINNQTGTVSAGESLKATAPALEGYTIGTNSTSVFVDGSSDVEITFTYTPQVYTVIANTQNDNNDSNNYAFDYGAVIDLTQANAELGTKANYTFGGWYYDNTYSRPVGANDTMPAANVLIYAKWTPTPIQISFDPQISGKPVVSLGSVVPSPDNAVTFAKPASDPVYEGYIFVDYYEDAGCTEVVTWPLSFNLGDADKTVYGRYEDVNGKISFDSKGGSAVAPINFTTGTPISQPAAPTKQGYQFAGWFYDSALTQPIPGWTTLLYDGSTLVGSEPDDGTITMSTMTGFVAYAAWKAETHTITFKTNIPSSEKSKFNTTGNLPTISGPSNEPITQEDLNTVVTPKRYGWEFSHWSLNGVEYDLDKYPTSDITLLAEYKRTDASAFIDITAYQPLAGVEEEVTEASRGDIITFKMTTQTNFYTGSSLFIFMYDKNFYEVVDAAHVDADGNTNPIYLEINDADSYISGIDAKMTFVIDENGNRIRNWPDSIDKTQYAAIQVALDPTISSTNYNTEPMNGENHMIEFKLRIKDTATGSGTVYMDNAWTRGPENVMGTMFYGWTSSSTSVLDTVNNKVVPDLTYATATVTVDDETHADTTAVVSSGDGEFPDGSTTNTYTGRADSEILDYPGTPTLAGYHLIEGEEFIRTDLESDVPEYWIEGFYPSEEIGSAEYIANWQPNEWTVKFFKKDTDASPYSTSTIYYDRSIADSVPADPTLKGYEFDGWLDENGDEVDFDTFTAPDHDVTFTAKWAPGQNSYTIYYVYNNGTTDVALSNKKFTNACLTDNVIAIVDEIPSTPDANTVYVLTSDLDPNVNGYGYAPELNTLPVTATVSANNGASLTVYCKKVPIKDTFNATTGTFPDGTTTMTYEGLEGSTYAENGITADNIIKPTREGYDFAGYSATGGTSETWSPSSVISGRIWRATYTIQTYTYRFYTAADTYTESNVNYNVNITAPSAVSKEGYSFKGWSTVGFDDVAGATTSLGRAAAGDPAVVRNFYAVYAINNYNVYYELDGELYDEIEGQNLPYGSTVTVGAKPDAETGYEFKGWYLNGDETNALDAGATFTLGASDAVLSGSIVAKTYDVTFKYNIEGKADYVAEVEFGDTITAPSVDPGEKQGYEFKGWSTVGYDDINGATTNLGVLDTEGKTFYAVWKATINNYYVDIYKEVIGGGYPAVPDDTITLSGPVGETCEEYVPETLTGFKVDPTSVLSGVITAPGTDLRLVVKYERNVHVLNMVVEGIESKVGDYYYGETITAPADPSKEGYTFDAWYSSSDLSTHYTFTTMPDNNVTVYANFIANQYDIKFYESQEAYTAAPDAPRSTVQAAYESQISDPGSIPRTGYTFAGWAVPGTTAAIDFTANPQKVALGGNSFVALWTVNQYDLTYRNNGVIVGETYKVDYNTPVASFPKPADPVVPGYTFNGWDYGTITAMPAEAVNINAKMIQESYTINFLDTDESVLADPITAVYGESISAPEAPSKDGYTFAGWKLDGADYTVPETMADLGADGASINVYASWTPNNYTITFDEDGGSNVEDITAAYGSTVTAPAEPTKTGYSFGGWFEEDSDTAYTFTTMPLDGTALKAKWTPKTDTAYTVVVYTMDAEGEYGEGAETPKTGTTDATVTFDDVKPALDPGYKFGAHDSSKVIAADGSMVFNIYVDRETYTLTVTVDGTTRDTVDYLYGAAVAVPTAPTKDGYTFAGWANIPAAMPAENVEITATWTANTYKITFNSDGGSDVADIEAAYESDISDKVPADPEKTGFVFGGWFEDGAAAAYVFDKMPLNGTALKAKWNPATDTAYTVVTYTMGTDGEYGEGAEDGKTGTTNAAVTFDDVKAELSEGFVYNTETSDTSKTIAADGSMKFNLYVDRVEKTFTVKVDGAAVVEEKYLFGATVAQPETPDKEGYDFNGWDAEVPATMPAEDVTINATWAAETYTGKVVFNANDGAFSDGTTEKAVNATYDQAIAVPDAVPTRAGYTFAGWKDANNNAPATLATDLDGADDTGDITITYLAQWTAETYNPATGNAIIFNANGGKFSDGTSEFKEGGTFGETIAVPTAPTKSGYDFAGWEDADGNAPATLTKDLDEGDLVFTAQWTEKVFTEENGVVFNAGDGQFADETTTKTVGATYGSEISAPADPVRYGYDFAGWLDSDDNAPGILDVDLDEVALTFTAQWTPETYEDGVVFNAEGGKFADDSAEMAVNATFGSAVSAPVPNPTKLGFTFAGWALTAEGEAVEISALSTDLNGINDDQSDVLTYHALWAAATDTAYTVVINTMDTAGEYTVIETEGFTGTTGDEVLYADVIAALELEAGFSFNEAKSDKTATIAADGSTEFNVYVDRNLYEATFTAGEFSDTVETRYGMAITAPTAPAETGGRFVKWVDASGNEPSTMPIGGAAFTAIYEGVTYTVSYYVNGNFVGSYNLVSGDVIPASFVGYTTPAGFSFDGWYVGSISGSKLASDAKVIASDVDLYGTETAIEYDVIFDAGEGTFGTESTYTVKVINDQLITAPADPTWAGHTFVGWDKPFGFFEGSEDLTINAIWDVDHEAFKVTYKTLVDEADPTQGYEVYAEYPLGTGDALETPADPYVENYVFLGWTLTAGDTENILQPETIEAATMGSADVTYYAVFGVDVFTVTFYDYDGTNTHGPATANASVVTVYECGEEYSSAAYNPNAPITFPTDPSLKNYNFLGWFDAAGNKWEAGATMPTANLELYAKYERHVVKLIPADGKAIIIERDGATEKYADNSVTYERVEPAKEGNFSEWYIYGYSLNRLSANTIKAGFTVYGDGYVEYDTTNTGSTSYMGTGAIVKVYDGITDELVEQFYIIIFGDLDGDMKVSVIDSSLMKEESSGTATWSTTRGSRRIPYLIKAADNTGEGRANYADYLLLADVVGRRATIDQTTGLAS